MADKERRARHFRALRVKLECGHVALLNTSRWRVQKALAAVLYGHAVRQGVRCTEGCSGLCQPVEYLGTCRLEEGD